MESSHLATCRDEAVRAGAERRVAWLDAEVAAAAERLWAEAARASPAWCLQDERLGSIPGIGPVVSRTLLAWLPEPGATGGGRLAPMAGMAWDAHDSGPPMVSASPRRAGRRPKGPLPGGAGGGPQRRPAAGIAEGPRSRGKQAKGVVIAVVHKLLMTANAVVRSGRAW